MSDRILVYGRTTAADRGRIKTYKATWAEIAELFREPVRRQISMATYQASSPKARADSKNTGLFFGGKCADGHRGDSSLEYRSIVNLDLDDHCDDIWEQYQLIGAIPGLEGIAHLVHPTPTPLRSCAYSCRRPATWSRPSTNPWLVPWPRWWTPI